MANYYFKLCIVSLAICSSLGDVLLLLFVDPTTLYESKVPGTHKLTLVYYTVTITLITFTAMAQLLV